MSRFKVGDIVRPLALDAMIGSAVRRRMTQSEADAAFASQDACVVRFQNEARWLPLEWGTVVKVCKKSDKYDVEVWFGSACQWPQPDEADWPPFIGPNAEGYDRLFYFTDDDLQESVHVVQSDVVR